jgi:hypothetical protein
MTEDVGERGKMIHGRNLLFPSQNASCSTHGAMELRAEKETGRIGWIGDCMSSRHLKLLGKLSAT